MKRRWGLVLACTATVAILGTLGWFWWSSLVPGEYSVMEMGYPDYGGGPQPSGSAGDMGHAMDADAVSIDTLGVNPDRRADVEYELAAEKQTFTLASGKTVDGYTLNGESPGPTIRATYGDLVEVTSVNESVPDGITLHWHGIDVPKPMDGVAGVTQNAVLDGEKLHLPFRRRPGRNVLVPLAPGLARAGASAGCWAPCRDPSASQGCDRCRRRHARDGPHLRRRPTVNGDGERATVDAAQVTMVRVRVVNTDNGPMSVWASGAPYRVVAVDGYDINEPD